MQKRPFSNLAPIPLKEAQKPQLRLAAPELSPGLLHILQEVQRVLGVERPVAEGEPLPTSDELLELVKEVATKLGFELTTFERDQIVTQLERDQKPFGILDDLISDPAISDIIVSNFQQISIQQGRQTFSTGKRFASQEMYETFVEKLLNKAGTTYSTKKPIADGMLFGFARIHVVHKCIAESGPYLTIRLNRYSSVSMDDLLKSGLAPKPILRYLSTLIKTGHTMLLVGEVGTGKTTLARALASSIPESESILVIEDTPEIKLEHPHVRSVTTRVANADGEGKISASEVIRGGMRMAMNRIVFGEIRDAEAAEAFIDVCASGHPGLSTIHARSAGDALVRLQFFLGRIQRGVAAEVLQQQIVTAVNVIIFLNVDPVTRARRIMEIKEIGPVSDGAIRQKDMFLYQTNGSRGEWRMVNVVSNHREALESGENPVQLHTLPRIISWEG